MSDESPPHSPPRSSSKRARSSENTGWQRESSYRGPKSEPLLLLEKVKRSLSTTLDVARSHNAQADKDDRIAAGRSTGAGAAPPTVLEKIVELTQRILRKVRHHTLCHAIASVLRC